MRMTAAEFRKKYKPKEHGQQQQGMNFMQSKGYYVLRVNSGFIQTKNGSWIKLAPKGTPDTMNFKKCPHGCCNCVQLIWVEYKREGEKPSFEQETVMEELRSFGAECLVVTDYIELEEYPDIK